MLALLAERFRKTVETRPSEREDWKEAVRRVRDREEDPYSVASRLFDRLVRETVEK